MFCFWQHLLCKNAQTHALFKFAIDQHVTVMFHQKRQLAADVFHLPLSLFLFSLNEIITSHTKYMSESLHLNICYISFVCFDSCYHVLFHIVSGNLKASKIRVFCLIKSSKFSKYKYNCFILSSISPIR